MKKLALLVGRIVFVVGLPVLWVYLRRGKRTRILIVVQDEFLVLRGWLGLGDWTLPGGGLHRGENSLQGLIREVAEETGVALYEKDVQYLGTKQYRNYGIRFTYDYFAVQLDEKPNVRLQKSEIVEHRWVPLSRPGIRLSPDAILILDQWKK